MSGSASWYKFVEERLLNLKEIDEDDESFFTNGDDSLVGSLMPSPLVLSSDRTPASSPAPAVESISHRTRSKFSLSNTPLEMIERAFVPPDVSEDMYDPVKGNQEWLDFLKGLVQPIDSQADGAGLSSPENYANDDNDDETDPEYNVMSDEELEAPDIEELRNDRTVKVTKKEMSELMSELAEYTQMLEEGYHSEEENGEADEAIENLINAQPLATFPEVHIPSDDDGITEMENLISIEQSLLIQQQLQQHTQLLLQTYLLSMGNPFVGVGTRAACKECLIEIRALERASPGSLLSSPIMDSTFSLMETYEKYVSSKELYFWDWHRAALTSGKKNPDVPVHPHLMELCLLSCAFPYPLLLPKASFKPGYFFQKIPFTDAMNRLIVLALDDCVVNLKLNINVNSGLRIACDIIRSVLLPDRPTESILRHVQTMKKSSRSNPIKNYFLGLGHPVLEHFVTPLNVEPLYKKSPMLIDNSWHLTLYAVMKKIRNGAASQS